MKIVMCLEEKLVDSVMINKEKITVPGYISSVIRELKEKHEEVLLQSNNDAEFLLFPLNAFVSIPGNDLPDDSVRQFF